MGLGAASVPIYFNESVERLVYILNDSGARDCDHLRRSAGAADCGMRANDAGLRTCDSAAPPSGLARRNSALRNFDRNGRRRGCRGIPARAAQKSTGDQLATIIYTSGTTGEPKGVMLNHANLSSNAIDSLQKYVSVRRRGALVFAAGACVRTHVGYGYLFRGVSVAYLEQIEDGAEALLEVHPTMTAAVPRFFEKVYANIVEKGHRETGVKRKIFDWAMHVAQESVPWRAYGNKPASLD